MKPSTIHLLLLLTLILLTLILLTLLHLHPETQHSAEISTALANIVTSSCQLILHNAVSPEAAEGSLLPRCVPAGVVVGVVTMGGMWFGRGGEFWGGFVIAGGAYSLLNLCGGGDTGRGVRDRQKGVGRRVDLGGVLV
ncbi:hypothetical protein B0J18DRAFT_430838 [Chaetomium sp. MPI-SDFR-AT-0129]|nr:hypothetical protein B0J18DRAFT_430838 [Chaetomium sp. MPI-SDFR-AT-0129]